MALKPVDQSRFPSGNDEKSAIRLASGVVTVTTVLIERKPTLSGGSENVEAC
jgi:hypothetical protein